MRRQTLQPCPQSVFKLVMNAIVAGPPPPVRLVRGQGGGACGSTAGLVALGPVGSLELTTVEI